MKFSSYTVATRALLLVSFIAWISACSDSSAPELASLSSVSPAILEPGDVLRLEGAGFVPGTAFVSLRGHLQPSGISAERPLSARLEGTAVNEREIEIPVTAAVMRKLAGETAIFRGRVDIEFPGLAPVGRVRITAHLEDVELALRPAAAGVVTAALNDRKARRYLAALGISLGEADSDDALVISRVGAGSAADRAGLEPGDRLLTADERDLTLPQELSALLPTQEHAFEIVTPTGELHRVRLSSRFGAVLDSDELAAIALASVALGLFAALIAPSRRKHRPRERAVHPALSIAGFILLSLPMLLLPAGAILSRPGLDATLFLMGLHLLGLLGLTLFGDRRPMDRASGFVVHLLPIPAVIAVAGSAGTSIGLWEVVASQHAAIWSWHVWSNPFALLTALATLSCLWPAMGRGESSRPVADATRWLVVLPGALLFTAFFLGGWLVPGLPAEAIKESATTFVFGCGLFFLKAWAVLLIARWLAGAAALDRRHLPAKGLPWLRPLALGLFATGAVSWMWTDIPASVRAAGHILSTACFATLFTALLVFGIKQVAPLSPGRRR